MAKRNVTLHDKHKSTTALYPKIDASSFTQGAIEKVAEISKDEIEDNVVPNETPTGTPTELKYITINGVEYYIKEGTLVIANPTLAGTEEDLTGIQIGDVKYKISAGGGSGTHLYQHNIKIRRTVNPKTEVNVIILNENNVSFTGTTLKTYIMDKFSALYSNLETTAGLMASGGVYVSSRIIVSNLVGNKDNNSIMARGLATTNQYDWVAIDLEDTNTSLVDNVLDLGVASGGGGGTQVQANWNETDTTSPAYIQNKPTIPTGIASTKELLNSIPNEIQMPNTFDVSLKSLENFNDEIEISGFISSSASGTTRICHYFKCSVKATDVQAVNNNNYHSNYAICLAGQPAIFYANFQVTLFNNQYSLTGGISTYTGSDNYYIHIDSVKEILS